MDPWARRGWLQESTFFVRVNTCVTVFKTNWLGACPVQRSDAAISDELSKPSCSVATNVLSYIVSSVKAPFTVLEAMFLLSILMRWYPNCTVYRIRRIDGETEAEERVGRERY